MGLSVYYRYSIKADAETARRLVENLHAIASRLPFDRVSEITEYDPPDGKYVFKRQPEGKGIWRPGTIYFDRRRKDGLIEVVQVPSLHSLRFVAQVEGAETAAFGLASHPPIVVHREDIIRKTRRGEEHLIGAGKAVEFPTRQRGWYAWQECCKTQYAAHPSKGGLDNFLRAHLTLFEMIEECRKLGMRVYIRDDAKYWRHRNREKLVAELKRWDELVAGFVGPLSDALGKSQSVVAPIKDRSDFEHLEAKGVDRLAKMARARKKRKRRQPE